MDGNIFASAEIYYSFGAIFSGFLILRIFRKMNSVLGVIILMLIVSIAFYFIAMDNSIWIFFAVNFLIGITNAGVRILRTTYIFNNIPNNLIGRSSSVFNTLNIIIRMFLISIFTLAFFQISDNIRFGYLVGSVMMLVSIIPLMIWYKKIVYIEKK
jgi:MFS family permease